MRKRVCGIVVIFQNANGKKGSKIEGANYLDDNGHANDHDAYETAKNPDQIDSYSSRHE